MAGADGKLFLRIDDLDRARFRPEYLEDVFRVIGLLGIKVTDGPRNSTDFRDRWSQQRRLAEYRATLGRLRHNTDRLFACRCSRRELNAGHHPYGCLEGKVPLNEAGVAWRIDSRGLPPVVIPDLVRPQPWTIDVDATMRDFAVRRKDGTPSYQLACTVDDVLFGINTVGRGQDLLPSTAAQVLLSDMIGYEPLLERVDFLHHPLIKGEDGEKLSKSAGARSGPLRNVEEQMEWLAGCVAGWMGED